MQCVTPHVDPMDLVRRALDGDRACLSELASTARERVVRYIQRVLLDPETAEDLAQDTLVTMLESFQQLRQAERFWSWLFRIAANKTRDYLRRQKRRSGVLNSLGEGESDQSTFIDAGSTPLEALCGQELTGEVTRAIGRLHDGFQLVLAMRFYAEKSHRDIGDVLGCNELSAQARVFRAKQALARQLRRQGITAALAA